MQVYCHQCGQEIPAQQINLEQRLATCLKCGTILNVANQLVLPETTWPDPLLPPGLTLVRQNGELTISRRWFRPYHLGVGLFTLLWNGGLLLAAFEASFWIYLLPHGWIGVGCLYYVLTGLLNSTVITVNKQKLSIIHQPLPTLNNKVVESASIRQLYAKERQHQGKNKVTYSYEIHAVNDKGQDNTLIKGLDAPVHALYLEEELERVLGIADKQMLGELSTSQTINWTIWNNVAETNNLTFTKSKLIEGSRIFGDYRGYNLGFLILRAGQEREGQFYTRLVLTRQGPLPSVPDKSFSLEKILTRFNEMNSRFVSLQGIKIEGNAHKLVCEQSTLMAKAGSLQFLFDAGCDLLDIYAQIVAGGAQAIPALQSLVSDKNHTLRLLASQLIQDIATTTLPLQPQLDKLLCRECLLRYTAHEVETSWLKSVIYYGCRSCHRSANFFQADQVISVLDSQMAKQIVQQDQRLRINWFQERQLFDFNAVEIIQASEEDIERFVVQIGNDTDPQRQGHYKNMPCFISPEHPLPDNSRRLLERTFAEVSHQAGSLSSLAP